MKTGSKTKQEEHARRDERGAALITTLLVSMMLLTAGAALLMTTSLTAGFSADASDEEQAYVAAESGLQAALNVLRGNVAPNPLPTPDAGGGAVPSLNKINFRRAVYRGSSATPSTPSSNKPTDPATAPLRLSRWLNYNWTPPGGAYADRVTLTPNYSPINGLAYNVEVVDPDLSEVVKFTVTGRFSITNSETVTFPNPALPNGATLTYVPPTGLVTLNPAYPSANSNLGSFRVEIPAGSLGAVVLPGTRFILTINQTAPWVGTATFSGTVSGAALPGNINALSIVFDSASMYAGETRFLMSSGTLNLPAPIAGGSNTTQYQVTVTAPEPRRILVHSTGFGPKGSQKKLEMVVNRYGFDLTPPAPIVIRGADPVAGSWPPPESNIAIGSSNAKWYSGKDASNSGDPQKPTIAISLHDWSVVQAMSKPDTVDDPRFSVLDLDEARLQPWPAGEGAQPNPPPPVAATPDFLKTADKAREFLNIMKKSAQEQGRYMTSLTGSSGTDSPYRPEMTFVDGNCELDGGAGLLIVTGTLTIRGNRDFKGLILVLGDGNVQRNGGGNGKIEGAWYVARFNRTFPTGTESRLFLAPTFNVDGGGNGDFVWNFQMGQDAKNLIGAAVAGVVEY
ncbi:MAG TPA: pilus assembly PilX N-terminal domain-containing protein [Pyrinomonadaceae bacterium]|jgi:hypothetical protein|nr:pilus assembly PilX N-terminal domain-containing protein [Pyrinomonadaceae bacterium]